MSIFKGVSTALVTPFDENNKVNYNVLEELINSQIENGINGLVICGTTGESPTVTDEEKDQIFKVSNEVINGRVPFIAGTGTNNTKHVLHLTEIAAKRGADAVLINNPYYNKSSDEGIYKSYEYISDRVDVPIIVYNVPSRTGKNISAIAKNMADTTQRMENIVQVLETVAKDPVTQQSLKETLVNVKETSAKANRIMGALTEAKISADAGYSAKGSDWRGNLGVTISPSDKNFLYMGGYDIGEANKFDFIMGRKMGNAAVSMGAMQGELGVGLSYDLGRDFKLYSQLYDFDDAKVRLGGELRLTDTFSLYGETMDLIGTKRDTYMGVRTYF